MAANLATTEVPATVRAYLREHNTLTLATASAAGLPHAATYVYAADGPDLFFCTRPDTTTARHIDQNPTVSFTVDEYAPDWSRTKGVQGMGEARELLDPAAIRRVVELFRVKFACIHQSRVSNLAFFRITLSALHFIDNEAAGGVAVGAAPGVDYRRRPVYSVFRALPPRAVETIAGRLATVRVEPGAIIVRQGAPADKFFIIADGEVEVLREEAGLTRTVATLGAGQFFGEVAILRDIPRTATVRAVTGATLLALDRETFRALVAQSLATTQDFDRVIRQRLGTPAGGGS